MRSFLKSVISLRLKAATIIAITVAVGCGTSAPPVTEVPAPSLPTGLPTPSAPGTTNTYNGGQSPGAWTMTLNNTGNSFTYQPVTYPVAATSGSIQTGGGFSILGGAGLAYEVLGRAAVLRPASSATSPVFSVPQTSCYAIIGKLRFQYIAMFPGPLAAVISAPPPLGYGSIVASTDTTGSTWQFENLQGNVVAGPAIFTASCSGANGQASISFPGPSLLSEYWATSSGTSVNGPSTVTTTTPTTQSKLWIGPSGFFAADQSDPTQTPYAGASVAGMAEPSSALTTSALAAGEYLGFLYEAPVSSSVLSGATAFTAPVGFGQVVPSSANTMTGGIFPNDDVTATPNSDIQITLGTEDSTLNGLYPSASITVLDPDQNCANFTYFSLKGVAASGVNANGYITCTFPGVAVAGNPDGNYAIFVNSYNWAASLGGQPMEIFLFQQQ